MLTVSEAWKANYPGAAAGILVMRNVTNLEGHAELDRRKAELETSLRARFAGGNAGAIKEIPTIQAYNLYYKRFKKTYHVQLQLESVAWKGKSIPRAATLVEAMFMAELKNLLLTAGHDVAALELPVRLEVATGDEVYTRMNGEEQTLKPGEMYMADGKGIISSVLYGPDRRTRIEPGTRHVMFATYAPAGIGEATVFQHMEDIRSNVVLVGPEAEVEMIKLYAAR